SHTHGILHLNSRVRIADIQDGTSNTMAAAEALPGQESLSANPTGSGTSAVCPTDGSPTSRRALSWFWGQYASFYLFTTLLGPNTMEQECGENSQYIFHA